MNDSHSAGSDRTQITPLGRARMDKYGSTLDAYNVRQLCERIADYPEVLAAALAQIKTYNGAPVSPDNLRWVATHQAMCGSWIFDVLTGLADALETPVNPPGPGAGGESE